MPRFFVDNIIGDSVDISGEDAVHISKSLRLKINDEITLSDQKGFDYFCTIDEILPKTVKVKIVDKKENTSEPKVDITLYQAMPKSSKLEFIIQKAVELGVNKVVPVITEYCVSRPKPDAMNKKLIRLNAIALEAAKQSGRGKVPEVAQMMNYQKAIAEMSNAEDSILFYEKATQKLSDHLNTRKSLSSVSIMVGSEGGFSFSEAEYAENNGVNLVSLGSRILRCETAPLSGITAIMYHLGEF